MEARGAGLLATSLQKRGSDIATRIILQEPNLDTISLALKLVVIDLTELLQKG